MNHHPSLVLGPAKHTTVVTTTTITTTEYAPIPLPPLPAPSSPKDPKLFPLLKAPLPESLREFPLLFPDGVKATFHDVSQPPDDSLPPWQEEPTYGSGWRLVKTTGNGKEKEEVCGLQEAVERFSALKKRPLSGDDTPSSSALSESSRILSGSSSRYGPYSSPPPRKKPRNTNIDQPAARSTAAPPSPLPSPHGSPSTSALWATPSQSQSPPFQPDISLTTLVSLPTLVSQFASLPSQLQSHIMVALLRHCSLPVLCTLNSILAPTLARDFLVLLPPELTSQILSYLPAVSLFSASRVSRAWRNLIDSDAWVWRELLRKASTWYGGPSEVAFAERIWALRIRKHGHPDNFPKLTLPHPYKLLYKSRKGTYDRWQRNTPRRLTVAAHGTSVVTCLLFSRRRIISASDDHSIHMYSPFTGERTLSFPGHEGGVWALAVCSRRRKASPSPVLAPSDSPRGPAPKASYHETLVSGSTDRTVRIWDLETGENTHVFGGHTSTVRCLAIARPVWVPAEDGSDRKEKWPKRTMIVTGSRDHTLRVWRLPAPGEPKYRCFGASASEGDPSDENVSDNPYHQRALLGHDNAVRALAVHGRIVVSGSYDTTVRVWDLVTGKNKWVLTGHTQKVYSVVIDHMRNQTCSGSMDGTVRIWSLKTGTLLHTLAGHTSLVGLLSLSPTTLVSAAADSTLRIWDPHTGVLRHALTGHTGAITCFQHDEFKVLSGSDGTLKMWDTRDGTVTRDLLTGITGVWQVVFDRRFCIAASNRQDSTFLEVWDFGGDAASVSDDDGLSDDDDNSETDDPFDESRLDEGDVQDSESEDEDNGRDDNKFDMDEDLMFADPSMDFGSNSFPRGSQFATSPTPAYARRGVGQRAYLRQAHAFTTPNAGSSTALAPTLGVPFRNNGAYDAGASPSGFRRAGGRGAGR